MCARVCGGVAFSFAYYNIIHLCFLDSCSLRMNQRNGAKVEKLQCDDASFEDVCVILNRGKDGDAFCVRVCFESNW